MKREISNITQKVIGEEDVQPILILLFQQMPENWHLRFVLLYYREVKKYSWGTIYIKLGYVDKLGRPDKRKGQRLNAIHRRFKRSLEKREAQKLQQHETTIKAV